MINLKTARQIVTKHARETSSERVALGDSLGRILAGDVLADIDYPPFRRATMDGYACRRQDLGHGLVVKDVIHAGQAAHLSILPNECVKIMTGAPLPIGANYVIPIEDVKVVGNKTIYANKGNVLNSHISDQGADLTKGERVLAKGELIKAQHLGLLASVGCVRPRVARRPRVGIVATGDELIEPHQKPKGAQVRNSNSSQLFAQTISAGAMPKYYGISKDSINKLTAAIELATEESDIVLISGGMSMGDRDLVPAVLKDIGYDLLFEKISLKPGKPTVFGQKGKRFCFGLPGNPLSGFIVFELLIRAFIYKMQGHNYSPLDIPVSLAKKVSRRDNSREWWLPAVFTKDHEALPVIYRSSGNVSSLCGAQGLFCMPAGIDCFAKGTIVHVRPI